MKKTRIHLTTNYYPVTIAIFILLTISYHLLAINVVHAAKLEFSPASGAKTVGTAFPVQIKVDTQGVDTTSTDAVVKYDNTLLSVDSVTYGAFYETVLHNDTAGKLSISGMVSNPGKVVTGTGILATVNFKGLANGSPTASFLCTAGKTDDSNVTKNDTNSSDILDCNSLSGATFTLSGGSAATTSPTLAAGTSGGTTGTSSSGTIPSAGGIDDILALAPKILIGLVFLVAGILPFVL